MKSTQFVIGLAFPILLLSPWRVIAKDLTVPHDAAVQSYIPVTEMLLTEDTSATPQATAPMVPIAPGEIPVNEMLLTEDAIVEEETAEAINEEDEQLPPPFFSFLDSHQQLISNRLKQYTQGVDNFFTDSTSVDESTGSYLRITLESLWPEGQGAEFDGRISLKLRLPKTQKKLKLVIASESDEERNALERETGEASSTQTGEERTYVTGIEGAESVFRKWKIRPSIGLRIRSPLVLYFKLRANRDISFENWNVAFNETLYWFDDATGFGSDTTMRWDRAISDAFLFRSNSFLRYTDEFDYYEMSQTFSLIHTLSHKRAITYKIGAFGKNEPTTHATTYLVNALYRNNIHKDYLFLDIQPQLLFERENEFRGRTEILVRLQLFYRG